MIRLVAPLSLIDTSKTATGQSLKDVNRLVRQAHREASHKLQHPVLSDPVFVSFADASWANRKDLGSQCGYLCVGTERALLDGKAAPCCPISWHSHRCPRVARSSGSAEAQAATQAQEETEFIRLLWLEIVQEVMTTPSSIRKFPRSEVLSSLMRKVFLTQSTEVNPQLFPCKTRDRRQRVLP